MKKVLSIVVAFVMMFAMCVPSFAMKLTTEVPYEHTVTVTHNEGGHVLLEGRVCPSGTQIKINRFGEIDLSVILESGYHLERVTVNGVDVTDKYVDGNLRITNITTDVYVNFTFEKCSDDPNDKCEKVAMEGTVYLGDEELPGADMSFDFGSVSTKTDENGNYYVEDISEGRHIVTISKDGEVLAHITFVIEFADVDEVTLRTAVDGTQVVQVPYGTEKIYLDFYIVDSDGDGIPDQDPDVTDPNNPNIDPDGDPDKPDEKYDPDDDNDGILDEDDPDHPNYDDDNDGIPDKDDPDDDNDGIPDGLDPDDDNDGIPDEDDPNHPDRDTDDDGIPDRNDPDDDNDGIPDKDDPDDDNDGIPDKDDPDSPDRDTDGDGIPDRDDIDDDNDGLPDGDQDWNDNDGDGIPDNEDPDDDNDGIPDKNDPDADGDGHHDNYDGSDEGDLDNDGGIIDIGKPDVIVPDIDIPDTFAAVIQSPILFGSIMGISLFFIILLFFKRKKDEEDETTEVIE